MARIKYYDSMSGTWKYADGNVGGSEVDLNNYALKSEIPSIEGLATEDYVNSAIANIDIERANVFRNKTASFYGDSLTEVNSHYTKGYHSWVKDILGLASYNNYGKSGNRVSDVYNEVNSVSDTSDIIFVMCGVNDQTFSVSLGAFGDNTTSTTYGSLNKICSLLKSKYPTKLIVFITPHYQTKYLHSAGITSYEVSKAVREVCEKYAIPVYDNFILSGIYSSNLSYWTTDNCHWNDKAHEMVGRNLAQFMVNTFRYIPGNNGGGDVHTHSYTEAVTKAATCTTAGVKTFTCECGNTYTETIAATGHSWNDGVVTVEPTENTEGVKTYTCTVCGETKTETIPVIEHNHNYTSNIVAPTCTEQGYTEHVCACGDSYKDTYVAATGHNYVNGVCSICGAVDVTVQPEYQAKTFEVTGAKFDNQWHISLYVTAEDLPSVNGETVTYGFTIEPISDFTVASKGTGGIYCVDTVNDLLAGYSEVSLSSKAATVTNNQDGTYMVSMNHNMNKAADKAYWLFPVCMTQVVGDKFTISNAYIKVGGAYYPIHTICGAFAEETATITDAE